MDESALVTGFSLFATHSIFSLQHHDSAPADAHDWCDRAASGIIANALHYCENPVTNADSSTLWHEKFIEQHGDDRSQHPSSPHLHNHLSCNIDIDNNPRLFQRKKTHSVFQVTNLQEYIDNYVNDSMEAKIAGVLRSCFSSERAFLNTDKLILNLPMETYTYDEYVCGSTGTLVKNSGKEIDGVTLFLVRDDNRCFIPTTMYPSLYDGMQKSFFGPLERTYNLNGPASPTKIAVSPGSGDFEMGISGRSSPSKALVIQFEKVKIGVKGQLQKLLQKKPTERSEWGIEDVLIGGKRMLVKYLECAQAQVEILPNLKCSDFLSACKDLARMSRILVEDRDVQREVDMRERVIAYSPKSRKRRRGVPSIVLRDHYRHIKKGCFGALEEYLIAQSDKLCEMITGFGCESELPKQDFRYLYKLINAALDIGLYRDISGVLEQFIEVCESSVPPMFSSPAAARRGLRPGEEQLCPNSAPCVRRQLKARRRPFDACVKASARALCMGAQN